ncbi:MAG: DUF447 family protein [Pirellulaceae bacterium]
MWPDTPPSESANSPPATKPSQAAGARAVIIEGLLTTTASDGSPHVAPMGPVVDEDLQTWTLRPFASSTTFRYLRANPQCVFHVVDDVLPVVQATLGLPTSLSFELLAGTTGRDKPKLL